MDKTEKILESIEEEICTLLKTQPLNPQSIDLLAKLTDSMKDVVTASGMKDYVDAVLETDDGMSHAIKILQLVCSWTIAVYWKVRKQRWSSYGHVNASYEHPFVQPRLFEWYG